MRISGLTDNLFPTFGLIVFTDNLLLNDSNKKYYLVNPKGILQEVEDVPALIALAARVQRQR